MRSAQSQSPVAKIATWCFKVLYHGKAVWIAHQDLSTVARKFVSAPPDQHDIVGTLDRPSRSIRLRPLVNIASSGNPRRRSTYRLELYLPVLVCGGQA